jgi:hypothetical protein
MRRLLLAILFAAVAFAQTEPNVITVNASRTVSVPFDQVNVAVDVLADQTAALEDVIAALQPAKISPSNLVSAGPPDFYGFYNSDGSRPAGTVWSFSSSASLADLPGYLSSLAALQTTLSKAPVVVGLNFRVTNLATSPQATAGNPCPYPALFNDASQQAQKMASAAGLKLGPVVRLSDTLAASGTQVLAYGIPAANLSGFLSGIFVGGGSFVGPAAAIGVGGVGPSPACALSVDFQIAQ